MNLLGSYFLIQDDYLVTDYLFIVILLNWSSSNSLRYEKSLILESSFSLERHSFDCDSMVKYILIGLQGFS